MGSERKTAEIHILTEEVSLFDIFISAQAF